MPEEVSSQPSEITSKYTVLRPLGKGGMGIVYEANHRLLRKRVAVKVLHGQYAGDASVTRRFLREATAASQLRSRYVVRVLDADKTADGAPFIVMDLLSGRDLAAVLRDRDVLSVAQVVDWLVQVCSAMNDAHGLGIIHRDLKPSNIFIAEPDQTVRVLDFGISRLVEGNELTAGSEILGTPNYIAPEVLQGRPADAVSDLYAIGVIAYRALSRRFPCEVSSNEKGNPFAALLATVMTAPKPIRDLVPDLPEELAAAIMKALAKDPRDRFASAREMAMALRPFGSPAAEFEELEDTDVVPRVTDPSSLPPPMPEAASADIRFDSTATVSPTIVDAPLSEPANTLTAEVAATQRPSAWAWRLGIGALVLGGLGVALTAAAVVARSSTSSTTKTPTQRVATSESTNVPATPPSSVASAAPSTAETSSSSPSAVSASPSSTARPTYAIRRAPLVPPGTSGQKMDKPPPSKPARTAATAGGDVLYLP